MIINIASFIFILCGVVFFLAGTLGLLRFPDIYTRLHALTKADNVGLGLVVFGLALRAANGWIVLKMLLVWILVMIAGSAVSQLIARNALKRGTKPWLS